MLPKMGRPMAETAVEALQTRYEAGGHGDWAAFFADVHEDFELVTPARGPLGSAAIPGGAAASEAFADFFGPYEEVSVEPERFFEHGGRAVVFFTQRCRPTGSSATVDIHAA